MAFAENSLNRWTGGRSTSSRFSYTPVYIEWNVCLVGASIVMIME